MWNGNQQQYPPQIPTRLDYSNQIQQQQRLPPRQSSPSPKYSQAINNTYSSNSTVNTNNRKRKNRTYFDYLSCLILVPQNDRWMNLPWTDPAIISHGNKLDPTVSQWSTTTQSQGSSTLSSGNNLVSNPRWPQQQQSQSHMFTNGMYMPYSTTPGIDDGSRP